MYGTNAGFTAYHTARNRDVSPYSTAQIDAARLVGSTALDSRYRAGFPGSRTNGRAQDNEWPRIGAYDINGDTIDSDETPFEILDASYELAYQELLSPGTLSKNYIPPTYESVSVDGAVSVKYTKFNDASEMQIEFQIVDEIISPLMVNGTSGLSGNVVR